MHGAGPRCLGIGAGRRPGLHRARPSPAARLAGELHRHVPRRMPASPLGPQWGRGPAHPRGLEADLHHRAPAPRAVRADPSPASALLPASAESRLMPGHPTGGRSMPCHIPDIECQDSLLSSPRGVYTNFSLLGRKQRKRGDGGVEILGIEVTGHGTGRRVNPRLDGPRPQSPPARAETLERHPQRLARAHYTGRKGANGVCVRIAYSRCCCCCRAEDG